MRFARRKNQMLFRHLSASLEIVAVAKAKTIDASLTENVAAGLMGDEEYELMVGEGAVLAQHGDG